MGSYTRILNEYLVSERTYESFKRAILNEVARNLGAPESVIGTVTTVNPDGSAEVELNDLGRKIFGHNMRVVVIPPPEPQPDAPIIIDGGKDADSYKLLPGGHTA